MKHSIMTNKPDFRNYVCDLPEGFDLLRSINEAVDQSKKIAIVR